MDIYETRNRMLNEHSNIEDLPLRVTYYARVSTLRDEQTLSIDNQESHFQKMIQSNKNWTYVPGYADRIRGESAKNRTEFQRMIQDAQNDKFDLILTKEVSRFARDTIDSLTYTRKLLGMGVGVKFESDGFCTIEQDSELRLTIMSSIAQEEVRKLSERVKLGHNESKKNGRLLGNSRIFGYDKADCRLTVNESEAELVRIIFETYATGEYGLRDIEQILWDKGYRNRAGKRIHHNTISGIIQNPKYKGYYVANKVIITDYRTKQQKFLSQDEWIMYKDETGETVPAIVPEELWQKANDVFIERSLKVKATDRSAKKTSPLSGKIICGIHNAPFWRTSYSKELHRDEPIYEWICREKKKGKAADCATLAIYETELYDILGTVFSELSEKIDEYIESFVSLYESDSTDDPNAKKIEALQKELEKAESKKEKLLDLYTDDAITKDEFKRRNEELNHTKMEIMTEISELKDSSRSKKDTIRNVRSIKKAFVNGLIKKESIDRETINDLSELLVDKIVVYPPEEDTVKLDIVLRLGITESHCYAVSPRQRLGIISKKMIESYENSAN